ncbi:MAG TPA: hypothetical protein VH518_21040 [Tepidisphaeraceae bacterium]|jgi:hypothetical protein
MPNEITFDPDITRRDDPAYWAAAQLVAMRSNDEQREKVARENLARLGFKIDERTGLFDLLSSAPAQGAANG